ncbi:MAG: hypothetical protein ABSG52_06770 [Terriglobales bacterium]|jgi:hypothetical protein
MRNVNLLLCGNLWQNLGDQQAGWELIRCLRSSDPQVRDAAQEYLVEAGPRSIKLLQAAIASGALEGATAAECMVTLLDYMAFEDSPDDSDLRYNC